EFEKKNPVENKELINDFIKMAKRFKAAFVGYFHETEYDYSGASTFEMEQIAYDSLAEMEKALHLWMDMALNDIKSYREKMDKVIVNSHNSSVLVVFFGCIASFIIAFFTARALSRPLNDLVEGANKIAKGDFTYRIQGEDEDDIGKLITAFNNMSKEIDSNEKQIRAVNQQLRANEQQLRATNQQLVAGEEKLRLSEQLLKRKLEDLESFHKITVGRELKMIELKKEINSLLQALGRDLRYHIDDRKD
ncbi:MAG: HAMP domain-containing protein, partial [Candidatus Omnitrophota bacterium]